MIWRLLRNGAPYARGTYAAMLDAAESAGALFHVVPDEKGRPHQIAGRGFYDDGTEIPPKLHRGWSMLPVGRVRARRVA